MQKPDEHSAQNSSSSRETPADDLQGTVHSALPGGLDECDRFARSVADTAAQIAPETSKDEASHGQETMRPPTGDKVSDTQTPLPEAKAKTCSSRLCFWRRMSPEKRSAWKTGLASFGIGCVVFSALLYFSPYRSWLAGKAQKRAETLNAQVKAREGVIANMDRYQQEVMGLMRETPGNSDNKIVGLVAPVEPPKLPDLTPEQKTALDPVEVAAYERMQARNYNFMPKFELPPELMEPVKLSCAAADYRPRRGNMQESMRVDQYDPQSNAPLAPSAGAAAGDIFDERVAAGAGSPDKSFGRASSMAQHGLNETGRAIGQMNEGLSMQVHPAVAREQAAEIIRQQQQQQQQQPSPQHNQVNQ